MFSEREVAYLKSQRLARIATASAEMQSDVAPVGFEFDGRDFYVGGLDITRTLKYKNAQVHPKVALVVDDLESVDPWKPRGIKIHGSATIVERDGRFGRKPYIRIVPEAHWSWGIEGPVFQDGKPVIKRTRHSR
ncbi:MAG TPA: PPOX class F420-dependent oxidoreductase [Methylomirabilota bacterium]|nr:PPOX class F420-dependent oxidoreductase [Methylomirabilota bacterium]